MKCVIDCAMTARTVELGLLSDMFAVLAWCEEETAVLPALPVRWFL